jgi:hypothetical protein
VVVVGVWEGGRGSAMEQRTGCCQSAGLSYHSAACCLLPAAVAGCCCLYNLACCGCQELCNLGRSLLGCQPSSCAGWLLTNASCSHPRVQIVRRFTAQTTDYQQLLSTFAEGLYTEMDFRNEALNGQRMTELLETTSTKNPQLIIPKTYMQYTTRWGSTQGLPACTRCRHAMLQRPLSHALSHYTLLCAYAFTHLLHPAANTSSPLPSSLLPRSHHALSHIWALWARWALVASGVCFLA